MYIEGASSRCLNVQFPGVFMRPDDTIMTAMSLNDVKGELLWQDKKQMIHRDPVMEEGTRCDFCTIMYSAIVPLCVKLGTL